MGDEGRLTDKSGAWVDLALTLPIFLAYHLGVVFLKVKNASDVVTAPLLDLAEGNRSMYLLLTAAIGVVFAAIFAVLGRGRAFRVGKFIQIVLEGVVYAVAMRFVAAYVVGRVSIGPLNEMDPASGVIMSLGAGFYEELTFRVLLFGLGAKVLVWLFARQRVMLVGQSPHLSVRTLCIMVAWAFVAAALFSGVHYVGTYGDPVDLKSFIFRLVLGLALTFIFATRGFAAAVWSHALYDVWVLVL